MRLLAHARQAYRSLIEWLDQAGQTYESYLHERMKALGPGREEFMAQLAINGTPVGTAQNCRQLGMKHFLAPGSYVIGLTPEQAYRVRICTICGDEGSVVRIYPSSALSAPLGPSSSTPASASGYRRGACFLLLILVINI